MPRTKNYHEDDVLRKALNLFWTKGFHASSMAELVACMGISRASMYTSFPNGKEEIFQRAFEMYQEENSRKVRALFASSPSVKDAFYDMLKGGIMEDVMAEQVKGCLLINTATELIPGDDHIQQMVRKNAENSKALFVEQLQRGVESGELSPELNVKDVADYIFTFYGGLRVMSKINPDKKSLLATLDQGMAILQ
ncbi:MAG: TetR/AcrR family transcriptional regulator [Bacteroidota bacterium]